MEYDAVVLAGGTSRRMGVADKTRLAVGGLPLLDRVLAAVAGAQRVIVVGERRPTRTWCPGGVDAPTAPRPIWVRERTPGGGPAAAVAAGLARADAPVVVLLAGDLPLIERRHVERLAAAVGDRPGAVAVDDSGQRQWLCAAWQREALQGAGLVSGGSLRGALEPLDPVQIRLAEPGSWLDCDTPADLARAEHLLADRV